MSLIKEFQNWTADFKESKRLIERGKRLVRPDRIVLLGEFYDYAVKPVLVNQQSYFGGYFRRNHEEDRNLLKLWIAGGDIAYPVPKTLLEKDCPQYSYAALFGAEAGYIGDITSKMEKLGQGAHDYAATVLKNHELWLRRQETYPAVPLEHALKSMGWKLKQNLEAVEWLALLSEEGKTVADFWNDVNNLRDYSRHFPERKDFTGRKPPPKLPQRVPRVFGAGWNPPVPDQI